MPEINLLDPDLKNYYDHTEISIQVSPDGFSFCINSAGDNMIRAFRHYKFSHAVLQEDILNYTEEILGRDELLRLPHTKARICYLGRKSTIVPEICAQPDKFKKILEFNQPVDDLDEIHFNPVPSCQSVLIFTVPTYFAGMMAEKFRDIVFYNQATPLIRDSMKYASSGGDLISLQLNKDFFDMIIIREGQLKLYNSFLYSNSTDLLYFILYSCKQLEINFKSTPVLLAGEYADDINLLKELKPYLCRFKPSADTEASHISSPLKALDQNRFFTLINLQKCESLAEK